MPERNPNTAESDDISERLLALRKHVDTHSCSECRKLLHKLANSIHVFVFGRKLGKKSKPGAVL